MLKGREVQAEEIRELGTKLWPWHQGLTKDLKTKLETVTAELGRTEESQRASSEEKKNLIQERDTGGWSGRSCAAKGRSLIFSGWKRRPSLLRPVGEDLISLSRRLPGLTPSRPKQRQPGIGLNGL